MYTINELIDYSLTLEAPYTESLQTMHVSPKSTSKAIIYLSEKYPLAKYNLSHLKRAKKSNCSAHIDLLIAPPDEIEELSDLDPFAYDCEVCGMYQKVLVPKISPYTKRQLTVWSKLWPCIQEQPACIPYAHTEEELLKLYKIFELIEPVFGILYVPHTDYMVKEGVGKEAWQHPALQAIDCFMVQDGEYLCTDAYAILYEEPCIMCAMALVHSRVKRVYYFEETNLGAFGHWKLHERSVNYMYRVFKISKNDHH